MNKKYFYLISEILSHIANGIHFCFSFSGKFTGYQKISFKKCTDRTGNYKTINTAIDECGKDVRCHGVVNRYCKGSLKTCFEHCQSQRLEYSATWSNVYKKEGIYD